MKLLTLNCHSWREENQLEKIKMVAKKIFKEQYDVVALQEVSQHKDSNISYNNIKEDNYVYLLSKELKNLGDNNYNFIWDFSHLGYEVYEEGVALLSKHIIKEASSFYVSKDKSINNYKSRKVIKASIIIDKEEIDFYSCHLGWWQDKEEPFKYHADELIKRITNERTSFIMGDFNNNAFLKDEGYHYLLKKGLYDSYLLSKIKDEGITCIGEIDGWENSIENKRLDLILINKELDINKSKVIFNRDEEIVSDHFGVHIEL